MQRPVTFITINAVTKKMTRFAEGIGDNIRERFQQAIPIPNKFHPYAKPWPRDRQAS